MNGIELPTISVVTSCFNAGELVEDTIRSVVQQRYPRLQYVFIDGASKDNTLEIARRYERDIAVLLSERDDGQYHGIQKGMSLATGEVMAWLNGDDIYCPWTLSVVGEIFARFPDVDWIVGTSSFMNGAGQCTRVSGNSGTAMPRDYIRNGWFRPELAGYLQQESMFWRRSLWEKVGGLDLSLSLAADFDLWRRFAEHAELHAVNVPLALFRQRPGLQRSSAGQKSYEAEVQRICQGLPQPPALWTMLSERSEQWRHVCRSLIWKRAPVVAYSSKSQSWEKLVALRPLARTSLADLALESSLRRL
jgi:hypothetical protein